MEAFASILDRPPTEIERPKPLPVGTYLCVVKGMPRYDKSPKKGTPFVEFTLAVQSAVADVDEEALQEYLSKPDGSKRALSEATIRATYYLTEDAAWRVKKFVEDLGYDVNTADHSLREIIEASAGDSVHVTLKHRASDDGRSIFAEIADTARA